MVLKGNEDYPTKSKKFNSIWLMKETKNFSAGLDVKLNNSASMYHWIRGFINMIQGTTDTNDNFKLRFNNIYESTDLTNMENILRSEQLTNNGNQASTKKSVN